MFCRVAPIKFRRASLRGFLSKTSWYLLLNINHVVPSGGGKDQSFGTHGTNVESSQGYLLERDSESNRRRMLEYTQDDLCLIVEVGCWIRLARIHSISPQ
jgi:hypothetical protein